MKRSRSIRLVLLGGVTAGALATMCAAQELPADTGRGAAYANDHFVSGAGYYHAPYRAFFAQPYNHFDAARKQYFHGGAWTDAPHRSLVNISTPNADATALLLRAAVAARVAQGAAQAHRTTNHVTSHPFPPSNVKRSGFGSSSNKRSTFS